MRIPENLVIALFGGSGVGKTAIATVLGQQNEIPRRSCGNEVERLSHELGVSISLLPEEMHLQIDSETIRWVRAHPTAVVEGRYLHYVLARSPVKIAFVRLTASDEVRSYRMASRRPQWSPTESDKADLAFCARMYHGGLSSEPTFELDTSNLTVDACARAVAKFANNSLLKRD